MTARVTENYPVAEDCIDEIDDSDFGNNNGDPTDENWTGPIIIPDDDVMCCEALTLDCISCSLRMTPEDYCDKFIDMYYTITDEYWAGLEDDSAFMDDSTQTRPPTDSSSTGNWPSDSTQTWTEDPTMIHGTFEEIP